MHRCEDGDELWRALANWMARLGGREGGKAVGGRETVGRLRGVMKADVCLECLWLGDRRC